MVVLFLFITKRGIFVGYLSGSFRRVHAPSILVEFLIAPQFDSEKPFISLSVAGTFFRVIVNILPYIFLKFC